MDHIIPKSSSPSPPPHPLTAISSSRTSSWLTPGEGARPGSSFAAPSVLPESADGAGLDVVVDGWEVNQVTWTEPTVGMLVPFARPYSRAESAYTLEQII